MKLEICDNTMSVKLLSLEERFWKYVDRSTKFGPNGDCWMWRGDRTTNGYGRIRTAGARSKRVNAHRLSWEFHHKVQMPKEYFACHTCDTPLCCNPLHIFPASPKINNADMRMKGRWQRGNPIHPCGDNHWMKKNPERIARGERSGVAKLTESEVKNIFDFRDRGYSLPKIAKIFNVTPQGVYMVLAGKTWGHLNLQLCKGQPQKKILRNDEVIAIYNASRDGERHVSIAKRFGINRHTVSGIAAGKTHKHLKLNPLPTRSKHQRLQETKERTDNGQLIQ